MNHTISVKRFSKVLKNTTQENLSFTLEESENHAFFMVLFVIWQCQIMPTSVSFYIFSSIPFTRRDRAFLKEGKNEPVNTF